MAFPASVLLQLSRQPQNEAQNWILGIVANGLLLTLLSQEYATVARAVVNSTQRAKYDVQSEYQSYSVDLFCHYIIIILYFAGI